MRQVSDKGLALIRKYEGFAPKPYVCPAGYLTVGYGHVVLPGEDFSDGINEEQATDLLVADIAAAAHAVVRFIRVPLSDGQFDALVSFTYNLGSGALQRSTLRRKLNRGDYEAIPAELMKWVWAGGRKLKGLINRRRSEAILFVN